MEVEVSVGKKSDLERAQREFLCFGGRDLVGGSLVERTERFENVLVGLSVNEKLAYVMCSTLHNK